jgi:hypothetical protein
VRLHPHWNSLTLSYLYGSATNHNFIREIPIFAKYEIRMTVGSWDEKWVHAHFILFT